MKKPAAIFLIGLATFWGCNENKPPAPTPPATQAIAPQPTPVPQPPVVETPKPAPVTNIPSKPIPVVVAPVPTPPPPQDPIVATVNGKSITLKQLEKPLIESYGLNVLLNLVQLELVHQDAAQKGIVVTSQDIQQEYDQTVTRLFQDSPGKLQDQLEKAIKDKNQPEIDRLKAEIKKDNENLLDQFLAQQRLSRPEFQIVIEINAYLRKIARPQITEQITDENLQTAFRALYGERVVVRHIQCANLQEIGEARRKIDAGEPFAQVAAEMSRNPRSAALGGELPAFSQQTADLPQAFKDAAFGLKVGEVSDPVQTGNAYHLIKLEKRVDPVAVKFEDHKEILRVELQNRLLESRMKELRTQLGQIALKTMKIEDPVLKKQFEDRVAKQEKEVRDREQIKKEIEKQKLRPAPIDLDAPTTQPAKAPADAPAPAPAGK